MSQLVIGSIKDGAVVRRFGFHISASSLLPSSEEAIKRAAFLKEEFMSKRYKQRLAKARIQLIYLSRQEFLSLYLKPELATK